ncbi:MAG TPA: AIR synthase related protein, partial [Zoogloea sp.]|nr:AIR synthase related protein [Zoogloea sp.]
MPSAHLSEFSLIDRHFRRPTRHTVLGVGDDGAIVRPAMGHELVISTDMLVSGTHFLADTNPEDLGWKALAVNVSDMAAMGATPRWALLAAALPAATESWIGKFARGFFACAEAFDVDVIGGDTTKG